MLKGQREWVPRSGLGKGGVVEGKTEWLWDLAPNVRRRLREARMMREKGENG